jgi:hypothetical protein
MVRRRSCAVSNHEATDGPSSFETREARRTLFCLSAATSYEELRQRKSSSRIEVVEVDVAGAGNP